VISDARRAKTPHYASTALEVVRERPSAIQSRILLASRQTDSENPFHGNGTHTGKRLA
jgi:hypothetical protein